MSVQRLVDLTWGTLTCLLMRKKAGSLHVVGGTLAGMRECKRVHTLALVDYSMVLELVQG